MLNHYHYTSTLKLNFPQRSLLSHGEQDCRFVTTFSLLLLKGEWVSRYKMNSGINGSTDAAVSVPIAAQQEEQQNTSQLYRRNLPALPQQRQPVQQSVAFAETAMDMALYDPPRWGWTALGGIADVLSPQEVRYNKVWGNSWFALICQWFLFCVTHL